MRRIVDLLYYRARAASALVFCLAVALLGAGRAQAQVCSLEIDRGMGGVITGLTDAGLVFDPELEIEIAPDLSFVRLENSEIRVTYGPIAEAPQYAINSFVIKSVDEDQLETATDFVGAGGGRGPLASATLLVDRPDRKTVRMDWCSQSIPPGSVNCGERIIQEVTIYPHQPFLEFYNVDILRQANFADMGHPGGTSQGQHVVHGSESWIRPFVYHDEFTIAKGSYYNRYAVDGVNDPADGGSLNYNGYFVVAVFNPANGRGFGRVARVADTEIIKLLLSPGATRGIEMFHYPIFAPHPPFTNYFYAVKQGANDALATGRMIADFGSSQPAIECSDTIDLTATPYANWQFDGWTGSLAGVTDNPVVTQVNGELTVGADFSQTAADWADDFDAASVGDDPADWVDTAAFNSLAEDDSLFEVSDFGVDRVFGTTSTETNIHSHYVGTATQVPTGYEFGGRLLMTDPESGIGVTIFSDYPNGGDYYRFRRYGDGTFHITATGTTITGETDTGVLPLPNVWYQFRIEAEDAADRTWIRAVVWKDGLPEPDAWQVEVYDDSPSRRTGGAAGLWSFSLGSKFADDLAIRALPPPRTDIVLTVNEVGSGSVVVTPDQAEYTFGDVVSLEAFGSSGEVFIGWSDGLSGFQSPEQLTILDDTTVTATFVPPTVHTLARSVVGQGAVTANPEQATYLLGDVVELTAVPDPGWFFGGWSDDLQGDSDVENLFISGDMQVTATFIEAALVEDFESVATGMNAPNFLDTDEGSSLVENDLYFSVGYVDGTQALATGFTQTNIHSHYVGPGTAGLSGYEFTGRMRYEDASGGIGVTFFSQFPAQAAYYRLRRFPGSNFSLAPTGGPVLGGITDTGVDPAPGVWYRFKIEVEDAFFQTEVRAKVWAEGDTEPSDWQAVAADVSASRLTSGTVGVWSMADGLKYWDDFEVRPLPPPPADLPLDVAIVGMGSATKTPDVPLYTLGDLVSLEATPDPGHIFLGWTGDIASQDNPLDVTMIASTNLTATFAEILPYPLTVTTAGTGSGSVIANPDQPTYLTGEAVTLTADPTTGSFFTGWSGDASGSENPLDVVILGPTAVTANFVSGDYTEDFNGLTAGDEPADWYDTGANSSLIQDDSLFSVQAVGAELAFGTPSEASNIHSHFVRSGASALTGYRYAGRMRMTGNDSGVGVTFLSQFPGQNAYYRLRRFGGTSFHLAANGTSITSGTTDTGVTPIPARWYRFVVEVEDAGTETRIRAKVWWESDPEPVGFQIDAVDDSPSRLKAGTFGVWAHGTGLKYWDDLAVESLVPARDDIVVTALAGVGGAVSVTPLQATYSTNEVVTFEALPDPGYLFTGWSGDLAGSQNPEMLALTDDVSVTATFAPITFHTLTLSVVGAGDSTPNPVGPVHALGSIVTLTATPDPGSVFVGWSGGVTSGENPLDVAIPGDLAITANFVEAIYLDDFEGEGPGGDPADWVDTAAGNSLVEDDGLFKILDVGGNLTFGTLSSDINIHSHYTAAGASSLADYEYSGRVRLASANGGVGVTFLSQFTGSVAYYRLRRYAGTSFHIAPAGTSITAGSTDTGITPLPDAWYRFRIEVEDVDGRTEIRAKVWEDDGSEEPLAWQVDCYDDSPSRLVAGTVGLWSMAEGSKHWDDLRVSQLGPPPPNLGLDVTTAGNGSVLVTPDQPLYSQGDIVQLEAQPDPGWEFTGWQGALSGSQNPESLMIVGNATVTAAFAELCPGDTDLDADGICDAVDNCPPSVAHPLGWSNPGQADVDSDGSGDTCDNCLAIANGPFQYAPGLAAVSQCDRDSDGYGNACDGDLDQDGFVTPVDNPLYLADLTAFFTTPPGQTDLSCDGFVTPIDNGLFIPQLGAFFPGPSGRACAGTVTGACPP